MQNLNLINILLLVLFLILLFYSKRILCQCFLLNKYKNVIELFDYFCKKAYTSIYSDQIIGYISNGVKDIPHDEYETIQRNFIKLVIEMMGQNNFDIFVDFFGSSKNLITNLIFYMKDQLANDQLYSLLEEKGKDK